MFPTPAEQLDALLPGVAEVIPADELGRRLEHAAAEDRPLRVKLGIDPSRPDLHLGHAVVLRKLRRFQDLGHAAVLIIGDFTGRVGDPSGQSETRPFLTQEEIEANAQTYLEQAGTVLDMDRAEVRCNSEWLGKMEMADVLRLTASFTVARMLEREDFRTRYQENRPISVVEFLYPLMQAMDSVAIHADVEMGGTDQTFNLLVGRDIQERYGQDPQVVFTMPLLEGTDGTRKMSKSYDNYVGLTDPPEQQFGKLMRIPDELISRYLLLCTDLSADRAAEVERRLADGSRKPNEEKRAMARKVVALYHGTDAAREAEARFDKVHRQHEIPDDVPDLVIPSGAVVEGRVWLPRLMAELGMAASNADARRLIEGGGVRLDGEVISDAAAEYVPPELHRKVLQVGRRRFARLQSPAGDAARPGG